MLELSDNEFLKVKHTEIAPGLVPFVTFSVVYAENPAAIWEFWGWPVRAFSSREYARRNLDLIITTLAKENKERKKATGLL